MTDAKRLESRSIYDGKVVKLSVDRVEMPNGKVTELEVVHHPGATAIVPITDEDEVLLVRQYRYATQSWLLEVPAGKLDPGEGPERCAARELEEEIGHRPGQLVPLGWIWTTPGFTDEKIWLFLARRLQPAEQSLQEDEVLTVERVPFAEAVAMIHRGEICDSKSICALLLAESVLTSET